MAAYLESDSKSTGEFHDRSARYRSRSRNPMTSDAVAAVKRAISTGKVRGLKQVARGHIGPNAQQQRAAAIDRAGLRSRRLQCAQDRSLPRVGRELGPYRLLEWLGRGAEGDVWKAVRLETARGTRGPENLEAKPGEQSRAQGPVPPRGRARGLAWSGRRCSRSSSLMKSTGITSWLCRMWKGLRFETSFDGGDAYLSGDDTRNVHQFVTMADNDYLASMTRTLAKAARALASVHDQRIVHRDVKPANILLDNRGAEAVYLCDFGLGRDLDVATAEQMRDGAGTPLYMAPERLLRLTCRRDQVRYLFDGGHALRGA